MPRRPSERELLTTLAAAAESDDGIELDELVQEHGSTIVSALSMSTAQLQAICTAPPMDRTVNVRVALRRYRKRRAEAQRQQTRGQALEAASTLVSACRWHEDRVELGANVVLGGLLADADRKAIQFEAEGLDSVAILRSKLKEAARALLFSDLRCFINERGLNFRWHGGRGGLVLVSQSVEKLEPGAILKVEFQRPQPKKKPSLVPASPTKPSPSWLGDVLLDFGLLPTRVSGSLPP